MRSPGALVWIAVLTGMAQSQILTTPPVISSNAKRQPFLYVFAAGSQSEKFSRQYELLSANTRLITDMHVLVVPVTSAFLTTGWPPGLQVEMPDEAARTAGRKRFGWQDGKWEFLVVLVDDDGRLKLRSHDPVTNEQIRESLLLRHQPSQSTVTFCSLDGDSFL
jgi:hypothetical protein